LVHPDAVDATSIDLGDGRPSRHSLLRITIGARYGASAAVPTKKAG
jgi:hypothetical protein